MSKSKIDADEALRRFRDGEDWRLENEPAHIVSFQKGGYDRTMPGARLYLRDPVSHRWAKTGLWLVIAEDRDQTPAEVLRSFANVHDGPVLLDPDEERLDAEAQEAAHASDHGGGPV